MVLAYQFNFLKFNVYITYHYSVKCHVCVHVLYIQEVLVYCDDYWKTGSIVYSANEIIKYSLIKHIMSAADYS